MKMKWLALVLGTSLALLAYAVGTMILQIKSLQVKNNETTNGRCR